MKAAKIKQAVALARARSWRGNFEMVRRGVKEAAGYKPLSEIQWYNLQMQFGALRVEELKRLVKVEL
jgi:hypothetical protein